MRIPAASCTTSAELSPGGELHDARPGHDAGQAPWSQCRPQPQAPERSGRSPRCRRTSQSESKPRFRDILAKGGKFTAAQTSAGHVWSWLTLVQAPSFGYRERDAVYRGKVGGKAGLAPAVCECASLDKTIGKDEMLSLITNLMVLLSTCLPASAQLSTPTSNQGIGAASSNGIFSTGSQSAPSSSSTSSGRTGPSFSTPGTTSTRRCEEGFAIRCLIVSLR